MTARKVPYFASPKFVRFAVPLEQLELDPANEKIHDRLNIDTIKTLLRSFGWRELLHVREVEGRLRTIRGNGTTIAARELAEAAASDDPAVRATATLWPAVYLSEDYPVVVNGYDASDQEDGVDYNVEVDWKLAPVVDYDDDEQTAAAWRVGHNRSSEVGVSWDDAALGETFSTHEAVDWGNMGWSAEDLEELLGETTVVTENDRKLGDGDPEDEPPIPAVPAEPVTKLGEVIQIGPHTLHCADCMDVMAGLADNSVDFIGTDPPYGLSPDGVARTWDDIEALRAEGKGPKSGFMGRAWDAGVPGVTWARECLRVLKPGGYIVPFSATRTIHRLACAIEDAGFEIRDQLGWITYQGFPKSKNMSAAIDEMMGVEREVVGSKHVSNSRFEYSGTGEHQPQFADRDIPVFAGPATDLAIKWDGFGTALKPAIEPAVIARKPLDKIAPEEAADLLGQDLMWSCKSATATAPQPGDTKAIAAKRKASREQWGDVPEGAFVWRARPLRPGVAGRIELRVDGEVVTTREGAKFSKAAIQTVALNVLKWGTGAINIDAGRHADGDKAWPGPTTPSGWETGGREPPKSGAVQFLKDVHLDPYVNVGRWPANIYHCPKPATREREAGCEDVDRKHETVKPRGLFAQLLRLFCPPGGVVLEPFGGSGTTAVAAAGLDCSVIIAEREPGYADIIRARVAWSLREANKKAPE